MAILKIKLIDDTGKPLPGLSVKASDCETLQTNSLGMVQFLLGDATNMTIDINGTKVWSGNAELLTKEEVFTQTAIGFVRALGN